MGSPLAIHNLKGIYRFHSSRLVLYVKQKINLVTLKQRCISVGLITIFVDMMERAGGLVLGWKDSMEVRIISYGSYFITFSVNDFSR